MCNGREKIGVCPLKKGGRCAIWIPNSYWTKTDFLNEKNRGVPFQKIGVCPFKKRGGGAEFEY